MKSIEVMMFNELQLVKCMFVLKMNLEKILSVKTMMAP